MKLYLCRQAATLALMLTALAAHGGEAWWGLWNTAMGTAQRTLLYSGTTDQYVRLTAQNSPLLVGGDVRGVRFWVADKSVVTAARVWLSAAYPVGTPLAAKDVPLADLRDVVHDGAPTEVLLDAAVSVLPAANRYASVYVGFTLTIADQAYSYAVTSPVRGAAHSSYADGKDLSASGALALQVLCSGGQLQPLAVSPLPLPEQVTLAATEATVQLPLVSQCADTLRSLSYVVTIDGAPQPEHTAMLSVPVTEVGLEVSVPVSYDAPATAAEHELQVDITALNDTLLSTIHYPPSTLITLTRAAVKRTVMEEFTGTWCLNCVRGFAGINLLRERFADRFIPIAMHSDDPAYDRDPMVVAHYRASDFYRGRMATLGGLPSCSIDRWIDADPYCGYQTSGPFQTDALVSQALARPAVADVAVSATWTDATRSTLSCDVATTFRYAADSAHYRLILVLTADGLKGEGKRWAQSNGYNDYAGTEEALLQYAGRGAYLTDMVYDHVAVDIVGVDGGIAGSVSAPLAADVAQHYACTLSTAANTIIQDPGRLSVVAMLVDSRDGSVANAAVSAVSPFSPPATAVSSPVATAPSAASSSPSAASSSPSAAASVLYDLGGRRVDGPAAHGVYVVGGRKVVR